MPRRRLLTAAAAVALPLLLAVCRCNGGGGGGGGPSTRCAVNLDPFTSNVGRSAIARQIDDPALLLAGDAAQGRLGDFLLQNERLRAVIQKPDRHIGPAPYGGNLIDVDRIRPDGSSSDSFGEMGLFYSFGRTVDVTQVEILAPGEGGSAVVHATGRDAVNDYFNLPGMLKRLIGVDIAIDPEAAQPLLITTYYVLSPGDTRIRVITALCNEGGATVAIPVGDLFDSGGTVELFNPLSCTKGFGYAICVDDMMWFGWQGRDVAYGYAPYLPGSTLPSLDNAMMTVSGVSGTLLGADGQVGLFTWTDPDVKRHKGELFIPAGESRLVIRDLVVGRDLGEVATIIHANRASALNYPLGDVRGTVTRGGAPVAFARVVARRPAAATPKGPTGNEGPLKIPRDIPETVFVTDTAGKFTGRLPVDVYKFAAWAPGSPPTAEKDVTVPSSGTADVTLDLASPRRLTVTVADVGGTPLPAKVTVSCGVPAGSTQPQCAQTLSALKLYRDAVREAIPSPVGAIALVPPSGRVDLELPAGEYFVTVTRGPQYSIWPLAGPPGQRVDLTASDQTVGATLARVVDSQGWMSADFHVHAVNSPDAYVANRDRVLAFLAEGVDVIVSTDHDYVTDYAPIIASVGGQGLMATIVGDEVTPFDYGHFNVFPLTPADDDLTRGAFDWAGGRGATLRPDQIFQAVRAAGAATVHLNHPRGPIGSFSQLRIDTDTFATHAEAKTFRFEPAEGATAADTRLFPAGGFNAMEVLNPGFDRFDRLRARPLFNDWFVLLSKGLKVAGTAVSDTHQVFSSAAGYPRTFVRMTSDAIAGFSPGAMAAALNELKAFGTTGPFLSVTAHRVDAAGNPDGPDVEIGGVLAVQGRNLELVVEVQTPPWFDVTHLDVLTHTGTADRCATLAGAEPPLDSRIACDGSENGHWPSSGIAASVDLLPADRAIEKVAEAAGVAYNRVRTVKTIPLPAATQDTWFVVIAAGTQPLFPAAYAGVAGGDPKPVLPFAFSNPIFADADGGGYDKFPFGALGGSAPPPPKSSKWSTLAPDERVRRLLDEARSEGGH